MSLSACGGGTALVAGIGGEKVKPLPHFNSAVLILVKPAAHISTGGEVYGGGFDPRNFGSSFTRDFITLLESGSALNVLGAACGNVLETVTGRLVPEIALWKKTLSP